MKFYKFWGDTGQYLAGASKSWTYGRWPRVSPGVTGGGRRIASNSRTYSRQSLVTPGPSWRRSPTRSNPNWPRTVSGFRNPVHWNETVHNYFSTTFLLILPKTFWACHVFWNDLDRDHRWRRGRTNEVMKFYKFWGDTGQYPKRNCAQLFFH